MIDTRFYSKTQIEKAEKLAAHADKWSEGVRNSDGLKFFLFTSETSERKVWKTHYTGLGCDCPAGQRGVRCYHCLAAQIAADRAQQRVERRAANAAVWERLYGDDGLEAAF